MNGSSETAGEFANIYFDELQNALAKIDGVQLDKMFAVLNRAYNDDRTIFIAGNGGSAATASHIVCDFNKGISLDLDRRFRFVSLCDNVAMMTAISNDISYEDVFYAQLKNIVKTGDVLICISGSGNSKNVIKAAEYAKKCGATIIGLCGFNGGKLKEVSDVPVHVPITDMQKSEDAHMIILHMMAQYVAKINGTTVC